MTHLNDQEFRWTLEKIFPARYIKETDYKGCKINPDYLSNEGVKDYNYFIWGAVGTGKTQVVIDYMAEQVWSEREWDYDANGVPLLADTKDKYPDLDPYDRNDKERPRYEDRFPLIKTIKYFNATELMALLRSLYEKDSYDRTGYYDIDDFLKKLTKGSYFNSFPDIIIDDLGSEKVSEWVIESFYLIINQIYENLHCGVIITSNKSLKEIAESLGDRIASRIAEMCEIIKLEGKDRRL